MSLWTKLTQHELHPSDAISVHAFGAAVGEFERGVVTAPQVKAKLGLNTAEGDQLTAWWADVFLAVPLNRVEVEDVLVLAEDGFYSNAEAKIRLGL